jgi:hypothetical protein
MDPKRLRHQEQTGEAQTTRQEQTHREFATVDDLLRHDASQTAPPPAIAERLKQSLADEPPRELKRSWWQRLFSRP